MTKFQENHPNVKLVLVTPYMTVKCPTEYENPRKKLYDEILYPALEHVLPKFAISYRNRWMVDNADFVIAYIDRSYGGAYKTYEYAKRRKKEIYNLNQSHNLPKGQS